MPNAKRASMREGPLAQLFRKTAEDTAHEAKPPASAPEPAEETKPTPAADAAAAQRALPHPSLHASVPVEQETDPGVGTGEPRRPGVPSPQERLESAFSADIPASLMDPPAKTPKKRVPRSQA